MLRIYRIFSNNSRGRLLFFRTKRGRLFAVKANIRGRRLFQILLTGSRNLNILFYYPIIKKDHICQCQ